MPPTSAPIPLLDLAAQYKTIEGEVRAAVDRVLSSQHFILGPEVDALEKEIAAYSRTPHAIGVSSGTDAILVALMALDVGPGDEIITTPYTFIATASCIARLGAKAVFVDIDPLTYNLDIAAVEAAITPRTKAVMPVHLYGQMADMKALLAVTTPRGIPVLEDGAQAIGAERDGLRCGEAGAMGTLSFFPSKNLGGAGDGGMVVSRDEALAKRVRLLRNQGQAPKYFSVEVGGNFRLDALQAAILRAKLPHLDDWTAARNRNADRYRTLFSQVGIDPQNTELRADVPVTLPQTVPGARHVYNQFVVRSARREELRAYLGTRGIGSEVYYPRPMHLQECFASWGYAPGAFPESERAANETLALPIYPELTEQQQFQVVSAIMAFSTAY
jgi:dTDP-4-amino-4,6-dideoxygalactose transaminase